MLVMGSSWFSTLDVAQLDGNASDIDKAVEIKGSINNPRQDVGMEDPQKDVGMEEDATPVSKEILCIVIRVTIM
ncbi:hypothetical protein PanWU01x14_298740 [Parasponia andersonii]|uniref:Uncharacterized protein n=1 Tax=Parasponia andersonii TaxID=3476 RepID=A0A2P5AUM3_PARAD|nr:hypothetical protein PanWU01x14_298740 [Parasponia andersonii]